MRKTALVLVGLVVLCVAASAQTPPKATEKDLIGTWTGRWTGGSSGAFELTVTKAADGKLGGSVSPKPDEGDGYTVPFNSVQFQDGKATMTLFDPSGGMEITLETAIEGASIKGAYIVRSRSDGSEADRGTIAGTKKPEKEA